VALAAGCYRACLPERCMCKKIVAIALEEAAKVAEDYRKTIARDHDHCGIVIAAAIRALIPNENESKLVPFIDTE